VGQVCPDAISVVPATVFYVAVVTLIVGAADYTIHVGDFEMGGIALGTFGAIVLYQIFRHAPERGRFDEPTPAATRRESYVRPSR
jgi:xanthine/uracil permease